MKITERLLKCDDFKFTNQQGTHTQPTKSFYKNV